jgi:Tfp pilus assembly protein PilX
MRMQMNSARAKSRRRTEQQGVALITMLILLSLMTAMGLAMYLSVNSDMLINGYYRNFRGSFYAADSGLNIARQDIYNSLAATVPAVFVSTAQPIPAGSETAIKNAINSKYGTYQALTTGVKSWSSKYKVNLDTLVLASCEAPSTSKTPSTCQAPAGDVTSYIYRYNYHMLAYGQTTGTQKATLEETGTLSITAHLAPAGDLKKSFAAWGMFIDQSTPCPSDKSSLVAGTISGPVFTNGGWTFSDNGTYHFTDTVGSAAANAGYYFSNSNKQPCITSTTGSATLSKNGPTISPIFDVTPTWGQKTKPVPTNDYNQKWAVLDGKGLKANGDPMDAQPTAADMSAKLRNASQAQYPSTGTPSKGVYLPYDWDASLSPPGYKFTGGGIYVLGDASVQLSTTGSTGQIYTITDANNKTVTITIDNAANTTTISSTAGGTVNIAGVPAQVDPTTGNKMADATLLYVDGNITKLAGPGQGKVAVQDGTALTVTAAKDVTITGDILYKTEPVTTVKNQVVPDATTTCCNGTNADTLIPGHDKGQALGIFTAGGNINLANTQSSKNLEIDASIAAIGDHAAGSNLGGLVNTGNAISTLTIVGGRIQNTIMNINATTRNVFFDRRYAQGNFSPPWFPSTTVSQDGKDQASLTANFSRTQWLSQTSY